VRQCSACILPAAAGPSLCAAMDQAWHALAAAATSPTQAASTQTCSLAATGAGRSASCGSPRCAAGCHPRHDRPVVWLMAWACACSFSGSRPWSPACCSACRVIQRSVRRMDALGRVTLCRWCQDVEIGAFILVGFGLIVDLLSVVGFRGLYQKSRGSLQMVTVPCGCQVRGSRRCAVLHRISHRVPCPSYRVGPAVRSAAAGAQDACRRAVRRSLSPRGARAPCRHPLLTPLAAGVGTFSWAVRGVCGAISNHTYPSPRATLPRRRPASTATSTTSSARAASPARVDRGCALTMSNSFVSFHECV
jgi:hypothetical protein